MSDQSPGGDQKFLPSGSAKKRANPSSGWIVMILAGLIAALIFFYASIQGQKTYEVAVLGQTLEPGQPISSATLRIAEVNLPTQLLNRVVRAEDRNTIDGHIATGRMEAGDIVHKSEFRPPGAPNRLRAMSIPREASHMVAGALVPGDRVDVVDEQQGLFIAGDLEVLSVVDAAGGAGAIGAGTSDYSITVAVTPSQASALSRALLEPEFDVVRSTGSRPLSDVGVSIADVVPGAGVPPSSGGAGTASTSTTAAR